MAMHPGIPWVTLGNLRLVKDQNKKQLRECGSATAKAFGKIGGSTCRIMWHIIPIRCDNSSYMLLVKVILMLLIYYCHEICVFCVSCQENMNITISDKISLNLLDDVMGMLAPKGGHPWLSARVSQVLIDHHLLDAYWACISWGLPWAASNQPWFRTWQLCSLGTVVRCYVSKFQGSPTPKSWIEQWFANPNPPTHRCDATFELSAIIDRSTIISHVINHYVFTNRVTIINQS